MTEGIINNYNVWLSQNKAETIDFSEGSLLDNSILSCKHGIAFIFEKYRNPNASDYYMYFFRTDKNGNIKPHEKALYTKLYNRFDSLKENE